MGHGIKTELGDVVAIRSDGAWDRGWHGVGVPFDARLTAEEAGEKFGVIRPVEQWEVVARHPETKETIVWDGRLINVRVIETPEGTIKVPVGFVSESYYLTPDRDLAQSIDAVAQESNGEVVVETCGVIDGGKRVFFTANGGSMEIGSTGDELRNYVVASNSHTGKGGQRYDISTIRPVCINTLRAVTGDVDEGWKPAAWTMSHTGDIKTKIKEIRAGLEQWARVQKSELERVERLADFRVSEDDAMDFFAVLWSTQMHRISPEEPGISKRQREGRIRKQMESATAFRRRWTEESAKFGGGSMWLALNAWTGLIQNDMDAPGVDDQSRESNRMRSNVFGMNADRSFAAYRMATEAISA